MKAADTSAQVPITVDQKSKVPTELEKGDCPLNTFSPKKPFKAKIKSVERIVGPKATGETCHIVIETGGDIPFWEGQSYGVVPPVCSCSSLTACMLLTVSALFGGVAHPLAGAVTP